LGSAGLSTENDVVEYMQFDQDRRILELTARDRQAESGA
jgi:hypothetical protein